GGGGGGGGSAGGRGMRLVYRAGRPMDPVTIALKPPAPAGLIAKEIVTRFEDTGGQDRAIEVTLPAMVGLSRIKEVVIAHERPSGTSPVELTVTQLRFAPVAQDGAAGHAAR